jgi:hypothetical protein
MAYDGPVQTQFGPTVITGGIGGRRIELKRDNTFHFTDDGSDQVQISLLGNPPTDGGRSSRPSPTARSFRPSRRRTSTSRP